MAVRRAGGLDCAQAPTVGMPWGKRMSKAYPSALGWAAEIERAAEAVGTPPMEMSFSLLDEFRAERSTLQARL